MHWYKDHQLINIQERITRVNPKDPFNHSILIKNSQPSDSGHYLCVESSTGGQGTLLVGHQVTVVSRHSPGRLPSFIPTAFPQSSFKVCNSTWTNSQIWCTLSFEGGFILVSSIPVLNNGLVFHKNWEVWELALSYSYQPVIMCVGPPYALLMGNIYIVPLLTGGYNITCHNCIFVAVCCPLVALILLWL